MPCLGAAPVQMKELLVPYILWLEKPRGGGLRSELVGLCFKALPLHRQLQGRAALTEKSMADANG